MLKEIVKFIENKGLGPPWVLGANFFAGHLPIKAVGGDDPPERCMVILETAPGALVPDLPDRIDKAIQIWNRAKTYFTAREDAEEIFDELHGATGWELAAVEESGYFVMTLDAVGSPAPIANPNDQGLYEFSTNYIWRIENPP